VVDRPEAGRYELLEGDEVVGFADYRDGGEGALVFPHTVIDPSRRGQGLGEVLVRGALDDVRRRGATVVPTCWYVAEFIGANPDYADLLA
jgi:predicted GNAT family acetyltransferase